jgi:flagellin-like hook-associated protein FlgL
MSGITLKNPVINSVPIAINLGRKNIDVSGTSLSTGLKTNNDVVSSFLGRNLNDRSKILNQFYKNVGYGLNIAQTAQEGLNSIARTLVEMQGIINSVGGSETSIRTLNDIFQQKLLQIEQQTNSVKFDGVKLLTGEFGSDPTIKSKYSTKIVDVRKTGIGSGTLFEGAGTRAIKIIDVQNIANIKIGDTISLHDVNLFRV